MTTLEGPIPEEPAGRGTPGPQGSQGEQAASSSKNTKKDAGTRSSGTLIWRRFKRHKLAVVSLWIVIGVYLIAIFADVIAPRPAGDYNPDYPYVPPQSITLTDPGDGRGLGLYVHGYTQELDPVSWNRYYTEDPDELHKLGFFVESGHDYRFLGLFETDRKLFAPEDADAPFFLMGADANGRDIFSRVIYGTQISMSIGLIGVVLSLVIGITLGAAAGFFRGPVDAFIQRITELFMSLPSIPLWMALAAAIPREWGPLTIYFAITVLLSLIGWTSLAREVRGRVLTLRSEDYVVAARLDGASRYRVIRRHILPSLTSHIIASVTLAVPAMILAETSLSFLGLGLQPPIVSWGVLLQEAQNIRSVLTAPWLLIVPSAAVVIATLALNFLGDGLRDAADPYGGAVK